MRLLHIVAGAPYGGAETFSLDVIKALHMQGIQQFVICRPHTQTVHTLDTLGIPYQTGTFSRIKKILEQRMIRQKISLFKPDLIHCWMRRAASFVPTRLPVPVLGWFGGPYDLKYYKNCDFYMGVTKDIVCHIIRETGQPHRSFLVHTFGTLPKDPPISKQTLGISESAPIVLLLSRMHWKKGIDTLLEAAKLLKDVTFLLAGTGPDLARYQQQAVDLGVSDSVRFLGWRTDRAALLALAHVCVLPSRYEPFGTVMAEAWYAGVPLVATRADGARQYVTHGQDGLLCDIDDSEMLAKHIQTVLTDPIVRDQLIAGGKRTYDRLFQKDRVMTSLCTAYRSMIAQGKPG